MKGFWISMLAAGLLASCAGIGKTDVSMTGFSNSEKAMVAGANELGFNVFNSLEAAEPLQDRFISPLSLSLALSMTAGGAEGRTLEQMQAVLGFGGMSASRSARFYKSLTERLLTVDSSTAFTAANAIWADKRIGVKSSFVRDCRTWYDAEVRGADFSSPATVREINSWCSRNTGGKITSIIDQADPSIVMMLLNALYFKGRWSFDFGRTSKGTFHCADGRDREAAMMGVTRDVPYAQKRGFKMIELPYGNGSFVMDFILPSDGAAFGSLRLDSSVWESLSGGLSEQKIRIKIPEFKMEYRTELKDVLVSLGMSDAFGPKADFSGISSSTLAIDQVIQKTFVDVNRKGTEAAAVTAISMKLTSAGPVFTKDFIADRPFWFVIRELSTGAVLFIGQMSGRSL